MQSQLENYLAKLVSIQSTTGNFKECHRLIKAIATECDALGLHVTVYDGPHPALVATTQNTRRPKVAILAHGDIVPSSDQNMFKLRSQGEKLVGRGTYDMKFAIATALQFFKTHKNDLKKYDIALMVTTDEEIGGHNGTGMLIEKGWIPGIVVVPDGGEDWKIESKAKGILLVRMIAKGDSAHGARPWEGENAIEKLMSALEDVRKAYRNKHKTGALASINKIVGGSAMNQVPDFAESYIDFRAFTDEEIDEIKAKINAIAKKHDVTVSEVVSDPPLHLQEAHPLVREFFKSFELVRKESLKRTFSYGATDARWFANIDVPSIVIRPNGGGQHGHDEWIKREDLGKFYELLEDYLLRVGEAKVASTTPAVEKLIDTVANR